MQPGEGMLNFELERLILPVSLSIQYSSISFERSPAARRNFPDGSMLKSLGQAGTSSTTWILKNSPSSPILKTVIQLTSPLVEAYT